MADRERRDWLIVLFIVVLVSVVLRPAEAQVEPTWCEEQLWRCQQFNANLEGTCEAIVATATDFAAWHQRDMTAWAKTSTASWATITAQAADIRDLAGACPERVRWAGAMPAVDK
jgi:hypothetical protein